MRIGIFFGGPSREREISFAGGRTVFDNLNKSLFEPLAIFVDSHKNFILLNWEFIYKGSIRDFYPPVEFLPKSPNGFQIYLESLGQLSKSEQEAIIQKVGRKIEPSLLPELIDLAFLALHGEFGEDGQLQGLLESLDIPYTGSGIRACAIGMDKSYQKKLMAKAGFECPEVIVISKDQWKDPKAYYEQTKKEILFPCVVRPANQGSSIGVAILPKDCSLETFTKAIDAAFFKQTIEFDFWKSLDDKTRIEFVRDLSDIRSGLGFPLQIDQHTIYHPEHLLEFLNEHFEKQEASIDLESHQSEQTVIVEGFIEGKEFSCIVIKKEDGSTIALPPTEIIKGSEVFDYRSKYLPGLSRKETPIRLSDDKILAIQNECERLYDFLDFQTYARIDGFITSDDKIFLNDPNTTSGMLPSSFFFHQAAEIGLNPSQFLTFIIRTSLQERITQSLVSNHYPSLLNKLDEAIDSLKSPQVEKRKIGVILGGYSFERHISVESGRNIFEKLSSSENFEAIPIFLSGNHEGHKLFKLPINLLLKDNADDIKDGIEHFSRHPLVENLKSACGDIISKYASTHSVFEPEELSYTQLAEEVDGVFIALHGRPGEDGTVQQKLRTHGIPYNGSDHESASITIDKFRTLQILKEAGFTVANQLLVDKEAFDRDADQAMQEIEQGFDYPFIAKPVDDGCSSAVKIIKDRSQLKVYLEGLFRDHIDLDLDLRKVLGLKIKEEFPKKGIVLIESLIDSNGAKQFMEITGGLLTKRTEDGIEYEIFEPSEALAGGEILSLEEKFLAGEGQNITPARFGTNSEEYTYIASKVKEDLRKAAQILKVKGYARIDAFVRVYEDNSVETIIIEINSLPGMTPATCIFHQGAINGYKPFEFIEEILDFGFKENNYLQVS